MDELRARIRDHVTESADEHGVIEPNAEVLAGGLTAVLDFADQLIAPSTLNPTTRPYPYAEAIRTELRLRVEMGLSAFRG